jgi:transcriptional regulator with XRE-family HTH domain
MTAETFAQNLRAEMGRLFKSHCDLYTALPTGLKRSSGDFINGRRLPTPAAIIALATALGCPVERLTVSREELERRWLRASQSLYRVREYADAARGEGDTETAEYLHMLLDEERVPDLWWWQHAEDEEKLDRLQEECDHHAARASKLDCERTDLEYRVAELERRLASAEAACADVSWECPGCAAAREAKP